MTLGQGKVEKQRTSTRRRLDPRDKSWSSEVKGTRIHVITSWRQAASFV